MTNANKLYILLILVLSIVAYYLATEKYYYKSKLEQQDQQETTKIETEPLCANYNISKRSSDINQTEILEALLDNPNGVIDKYLSKDIIHELFATHAIPLTIAALITKGDILELGVGYSSTPILNKIAKEQNRLVVSIEMNSDWLQKFVSLNDSVNHLFFDAKSLCANTISHEKEWGLVFVDHLNAETRYIDMIKYAKKAQILIAHDSEKQRDDTYFYSLAYPYFKYHCKYTIHVENNDYVSTSLLSNLYKFDQIKSVLQNTVTDRPHVVCQQNYK